MVSQATAALSTASPAATQDTTRKLCTNDSCSARFRTGCSAASTFFGTDASASFGTSACSADLTSGVGYRRSSRWSSAPPNTPTAIAPSSAQSEHGHRREERRPVRAVGAGDREQRQSDGRDRRSDDQHAPRTEALDQRAGPARQNAHGEAHRQKCGAGLRRGVTVDADQIERQQEHCAREREIQQQRGVRVRPSNHTNATSTTLPRSSGAITAGLIQSASEASVSP